LRKPLTNLAPRVAGNWQAARDTWNQSNLARTLASLACFVASVVLVAVCRGSIRPRLDTSDPDGNTVELKGPARA